MILRLSFHPILPFSRRNVKDELSIFSYPAVRISNRLGILNEPAAPDVVECNNIGKDESCDSSSLATRHITIQRRR